MRQVHNKIAIVGSRGFDNYDLLKETILSTWKPYEIELIISGGAIGAGRPFLAVALQNRP